MGFWKQERLGRTSVNLVLVIFLYLTSNEDMRITPARQAFGPDYRDILAEPAN